MSYRALVLHPSRVMSPALWRKVRSLAEAGVIVVGLPPVDVPGLGRGHIPSRAYRTLNRPVEEVLRSKGVVPDFQADRALSAAHRRIGDTDVYFVANPRPVAVNAVCRFRAKGKAVELWNPETGMAAPAHLVREVGTLTEIPMTFGPMDSMFVVFRPGRTDPLTRLTRDKKDVLIRQKTGVKKIVVKRALWGPMGDPARYE